MNYVQPDLLLNQWGQMICETNQTQAVKLYRKALLSSKWLTVY